MNLLKSVFESKHSEEDNLKMSFIKKDDTWHVTKGTVIMYIGNKKNCEVYLSHMEAFSKQLT